MIAVPAGIQVLVATKPVDFRRGADGLVALVRETLGQDPFISATVFVFRSKRADRVTQGALWTTAPPEAQSISLSSPEAGQRLTGFVRTQTVRDNPAPSDDGIDLSVAAGMVQAASFCCRRAAAQAQGMSSSMRLFGQPLTSLVRMSAR
jgi:transposase